MPITHEEWLASVKANVGMVHSEPLRTVGTRLYHWTQSKGKPELESLAKAFEIWRTTRATEVTKMGADVTRLEQTIATARNTNAVINARATNVGAVGYRLVPFDPAVHQFANETLPSDRVPPLSGPQIGYLNECFRRARFAVELARDALIGISRITGRVGAGNLAQAAYLDYFGAFDPGRIQKVLAGFKTLVLAFQSQPDVVDLLNTDYGTTCYAACFRANLSGTAGAAAHSAGFQARAASFGTLSPARAKKAVQLTGNITTVFLGRAFFHASRTRQESYESGTNRSMTTLIHEFAHGAIAAVDAPPVVNRGNATAFEQARMRIAGNLGEATNLAVWSWKLKPAHWPGSPDHDDFGDSPNNSVQASTVEMDKDLAKAAPEVAIRNADCYGQFAKTLLLAKGM